MTSPRSRSAAPPASTRNIVVAGPPVGPMLATARDRATPNLSGIREWVEHLRGIALRGLARMYRPDGRCFAFRLRRSGSGALMESGSVRYTAIVAIGLAGEDPDEVREVLHGDTLRDVCNRLTKLIDVGGVENLGDLALIHWAAQAAGCRRAPVASAHLCQRLAMPGACATVELAWALSSLCEAKGDSGISAIREQIARRLTDTCREQSGLFAHATSIRRLNLRGHVACFADLIYPIHALARFHALSGNAEALQVADRCAARMCGLLGSAGQWWWHYDVRTGRVIERYPVYAVHQDAMAPMALLTLGESGGADHSAAIASGLSWLGRAPELDGGSLVDDDAGLIWRKVGRREPRKAIRAAQALAARVHPALRCPGMDTLFPAGIIDDECRPYHLGWLLYAWPKRRLRAATTTREIAP